MSFRELHDQKVAQYLKEKRQEAGLSQGDVAKELGYSSPQFISNWERGLAMPPLEAMKRLVSLYKIDREEFVELIISQSREYYQSQLGIESLDQKKRG